MAYDSTPISILNAIGLLNSGMTETAEGAFGLPSTHERRFLARTARQWGWGDEDTLRILSAMLGDVSCDVRIEAYESLIRCVELRGERLLSELENHLEQEPLVQAARARLLRELANADLKRVLVLLCPLAASGITWVDKEVTKCLSTCWALDQRVTWHVIKDWLHHRSCHVREMTVRFISSGHWPEGPTAPTILSSVVGDSSSHVRTACARGMSLWAKEDLDLAIPALRTLSRDRSHRNVRAAVAKGVTHWRKAMPYEALEILYPLARDPSRRVRRLARRQICVFEGGFSPVFAKKPRSLLRGGMASCFG
jgi:hypothetical protein